MPNRKRCGLVAQLAGYRTESIAKSLAVKRKQHGEKASQKQCVISARLRGRICIRSVQCMAAVRAKNHNARRNTCCATYVLPLMQLTWQMLQNSQSIPPWWRYESSKRIITTVADRRNKMTPKAFGLQSVSNCILMYSMRAVPKWICSFRAVQAVIFTVRRL